MVVKSSAYVTPTLGDATTHVRVRMVDQRPRAIHTKALVNLTICSEDVAARALHMYASDAAVRSPRCLSVPQLDELRPLVVTVASCC